MFVAVVAIAVAIGPATAAAAPTDGPTATGPLGSLTNETDGTTLDDGAMLDGGNDTSTGDGSVTGGVTANDTVTDGSVSGNVTVDGSVTNGTTDGDAGDGVIDGGTNDTGTTNGSAERNRTGDDGSGSGTDANGTSTTDGGSTIDGGITLGSGNDTLLDASLSATASEEGLVVSVAANSDAGVSLSTSASIAAGDGERTDDGAGNETNGTDDGGATGDDDGGAGTGGSGEGSGGGSAPVDPEDAGAGLAVGSLLVGGGLLARRFAETSLLTGGPGAGGAGGGSLLSAGFAWLRTWGWRFLALVGYARLDSSDPLEHETRASVYERIEDGPGIFLTELSDRTEVPMSTLRYHLRILEYEELIDSEKVRGKRRFFPAEVEPDALDPALEDDATAAVLEAVADEPDSVSGLADRLDRDPSTVTHHLQRLEDEELVEREREGRSVVTRLADGIDQRDVTAATAGHAD